MPRVASYQANQVGPVETTGARLRAADSNAGAIVGRGLQGFGNTLGEAATTQDRINAQYDEQQARQSALDFKAAADPLVTGFTNLAGKNAVDAGASTQAQITTLRDEALSKAANARQKRYLTALISPAASEYQGTIGTHAARQQTTMAIGTAKSEAEMAMNQAAAAYEDPAKLTQYRGEADAAMDRLGALQGWDDAQLTSEKFKVGSGIHSTVISQSLLKSDVDMGVAYFEAHKDEMTAADRNEAMRMLKGPLELRDSAAGFAEIVSGGAAPSGSSKEVAPGTYQKPVAGTVTNTYAQHEARGSHGLDIGAPQGSAIKPIAGGVVVSVSQDSRSGRFVTVRHADGHTSSYSHMGNQSVKVGDEVGPNTVIGTVGMTGHTTGPHVHLRVKDAAGRDVDPEKLMGRQSPGGAVIGSPQAARNWDQANVIAAIDRRTDWSIEKRERVKDYAQKRMGEDERLLQDSRQDADEAASAFVVAKREGFTDPNQMPRSVWNALSPTDQIKWQNVAEANRKPRDPPANGSDVMTLNIMRFQDPDRFQKLNLGEYQGKMTRGELDSMLTEQARMRSEAQKPSASWSPRSGIVTAVSYGQSIGGIKLEDPEKASVMSIMEAEARQLYAAKGNKALTDDEYQQLFRSATRNVATHRQIFGRTISSSETPRYKLTEGTMPAAVRDRIVATFKRERGREPNEDELLRLYQIATRR